jgi:hypothetical protein
MKSVIAALIICSLCYSTVLAGSVPDSVSHHPIRRAMFQALAQDYLLWATNHYILKNEWADISISTVRSNFENGWVWDEDGFEVNQIGHPIQGAMVYTAARAQGLSYLQSIPYPILSSFVWEMCLENESPSVNDMVTTTMSGAAFGEIIHRMSEVALGSAEVKSRWRQGLAGIINPTGYGVNRLVYGPDIHRNYREGNSPVLSGISFGGVPAEKFGEKNNFFPEYFIRLHIIYGDLFTEKGHFKPFDNFSFISILNIGGSDAVAEIYASGMIAKLKTWKFAHSVSVLGIFHNYDFMNQDDYKVSVSSIGLGYLQNRKLSSNIQFLFHSSVSSIFMGSAGDTGDEFDNVDVRDYHSGPGFCGRVMLKTSVREYGEVYLRLNRYFIYAMDRTDVEGYENINLLNTGFQVKIAGPLSLGGEYVMAARNFSPRGPSLEVDQKDNIVRVYLVYNFCEQIFRTIL